LRRRLAGRKYASAALCRSPRHWVTAAGAYPVLSGSFNSPRRRIPSSAHAARNANVVGFGSRNSESLARARELPDGWRLWQDDTFDATSGGRTKRPSGGLTSANPLTAAESNAGLAT
jgi:hypothetical protein